MHLALVHHVRSEADRLPSERPRVDEAPRYAKLCVLHVMIDELEPVHCAKLDLRGERVTLARFSRIESSSEIAYGSTECERRSSFDFVLRAEIQRPRALYARAHAAALSRAVNPKLHHFVIC